MNTKVLVGGIVGAIVMFLLGWLIYGVLMGSMMEDMPEPTSMGLLWFFIADLAVGLLLAYIYTKWAGISTAMGGAKAAIIIGLLMAIWVDGFAMGMPEMYAEGYQMTIPMMLMDVVIQVVIVAAAGAAIGWYLGRGKAAE